MEQEVYCAIMSYCADNRMECEDYFWSLVVMGGGDGSNCEKASAKASTHYIAYGVTVAIVVARCKDEFDCPVVCTDANHKDYGPCDSCHQHVTYCHPGEYLVVIIFFFPTFLTFFPTFFLYFLQQHKSQVLTVSQVLVWPKKMPTIKKNCSWIQ